jgi:hypothetical protein
LVFVEPVAIEDLSDVVGNDASGFVVGVDVDLEAMEVACGNNKFSLPVVGFFVEGFFVDGNCGEGSQVGEWQPDSVEFSHEVDVFYLQDLD